MIISTTKKKKLKNYNNPIEYFPSWYLPAGIMSDQRILKPVVNSYFFFNDIPSY